MFNGLVAILALIAFLMIVGYTSIRSNARDLYAINAFYIKNIDILPFLGGYALEVTLMSELTYRGYPGPCDDPRYDTKIWVTVAGKVRLRFEEAYEVKRVLMQKHKAAHAD